MIQQERVLVLVKTYPTLSKTYGELSCVAGIREDGTWIRLYPIPFRRLREEYRFEKYRWIELPVEKNARDNRPESYRPVDLSQIRQSSLVSTTAHGGCRENPEPEKECESPFHDRINGPVPILCKRIGKTSAPLQRRFTATLAWVCPKP